MPAYKYSALSSSQSFRLIEIQSGIKNRWSDFNLSLRITNLDVAPQYDALSYTWGNPYTPYSSKYKSEWSTDAARRYPISIDGDLLEVTANLMDALRALSDDDQNRVARKSRCLWIDAIYINQDNPVERAAQVSIMSSIFKTAQSVIIWLGGEDEFVDDALETVTTLSTIPQHHHSQIKRNDWYIQDVVLRKFGARKEIGFCMWLGLIALLNRPWFERIWVAQEVILARSAMVMCGRKVFPWSMLSDTFSFLTTTAWVEHLRTDRMRATATIMRSVGLYHKLLDAQITVGMPAIYLELSRANLTKTGHKASLQCLIDVHRTCKASDPRDMIFALLGIAWKERQPFSTHPRAIVPDYEVSVCNVYTNVAKTMLQSYKDLRFLSHVQDASHTAISNLPSWVPDYSVQALPTPLSSRVSSSSWRASGYLSWNHEIGFQEPGLLNVSGLHLDTITETVTGWLSTYDYNYTAETDPYWINVFKLTRGLNNIYSGQSSQSRFEDLWRTLIANIYQNQYPASDSCGKIFFELITRAIARILIIEETQQVQSSLGTDIEKHWRTMARAWAGVLELEPDGSPFSYKEFTDRLQAVIELENTSQQFRTNHSNFFSSIEREMTLTGGARCLFRTAKGYLGTGAQSLQLKDEVWVLGGADTPMILRKWPNGMYKLVGEAYVHGVMNGEAVQSISQKQLQRVILQ
ncbi:MAG: hypothetical protein Q9167_007948 [Letrouitia subvulpina]